MNECKRVRGLLALCPGEWREDDRRRVQAHLATCRECASTVRAYGEQDRLIRGTSRVSLSPARRSKFLARAYREEKRFTRRARWASALGTVAALGVVLTLALSFLLRPSPHPSAARPGPGVADLLRQPPAPGQTVN